MFFYADPGGTTGWASYSQELGFKSGQLDFEQVGNYVEMLGSHYGADLSLGWEKFLVTPATARKPGATIAIEVIGVIRWLGLRFHVNFLPCYPSSSLLPKGADQLRRIGWHARGQQHANDAAQHLLHYCLNAKLLPADLVSKLIEVD